MFGWVELPPEGLRETLCLAADTFQIIEVLGRDLFKHRAEVRHGHGREPVLFTRIIKVTKKEAHNLAALGEAFFTLRYFCHLLLELRHHLADGFHVDSIFAPKVWRRWTISS